MKPSSVLFTALYAASSGLAAAVPSLASLDPGKVIVSHRGNITILDKADLDSHLKAHGILPEPPAPEFPLTIISGNYTPGVGLQKRIDKHIIGTFIIPLPDISFMGWDVEMSQIDFPKYGPATVSIAQGKTISNSISGGGGFDLTLVKDFLSISGSVNYDHTTTSAITGTVTMTLPQGQYGLAVSNPYTHRRRGFTMTGLPGSGARYDWWQADSFTDQTMDYGGGTLSWVSGVLTTCARPNYPVARCHGQGLLY